MCWGGPKQGMSPHSCGHGLESPCLRRHPPPMHACHANLGRNAEEPPRNTATHRDILHQLPARGGGEVERGGGHGRRVPPPLLQCAQQERVLGQQQQQRGQQQDGGGVAARDLARAGWRRCVRGLGCATRMRACRPATACSSLPWLVQQHRQQAQAPWVGLWRHTFQLSAMQSPKQSRATKLQQVGTQPKPS